MGNRDLKNKRRQEMAAKRKAEKLAEAIDTAPVDALAVVAAVILDQAPAIVVDPSAPRRARIYAKPNNVRMRLIEFEDDKSHGKLWVKQDSAPMLNWLVWVKPDDTGRDWVLHGKYNARGTRLG